MLSRGGARRASPPQIQIVHRRGKETVSLSPRRRRFHPAHRRSAAWRLCRDLNLFRDKCRWAPAHLNISFLSSPVSQTRPADPNPHLPNSPPPLPFLRILYLPIFLMS